MTIYTSEDYNEDFYSDNSMFQDETLERDMDVREIYEISQTTMQLETLNLA